jgi:hypothetical protein
MNLVFFLEEGSAKCMLEIIAPKILNNVNIEIHYYVFQGKQDLEKQIKLKIQYWGKPDTVFLVMRDKDSGDCKEIKKNLLQKIEDTGKIDNSLVRIACHELESFYLGDLLAVEKGLLVANLSKKQNKTKYRNPDNLANAKQELKKIAKNYTEVGGSRKIAPHLKLDDSNRSTSFKFLISGIHKLCNTTS